MLSLCGSMISVHWCLGELFVDSGVSVEINSAERGFGGKVYGSPELVLMHKGAWVDGEMEFIDVQDDDIGQQRRSGAYHGNYPPFGTPEFYALYSCSANEDEWSGNVLG